jgi:hypothetical protein
MTSLLSYDRFQVITAAPATLRGELMLPDAVVLGLEFPDLPDGTQRVLYQTDGTRHRWMYAGDTADLSSLVRRADELGRGNSRMWSEWTLNRPWFVKAIDKAAA